MTASKHKTVLFLCTGNYYRSRYAEIYFNSVASKMELPWKATSR
jgi:protein-tyrosine phosphatase